MLAIKLLYVFNILIFFLFSIFYFNRKAIQLSWKWQALKLLTLTYWGWSCYSVLMSSPNANWTLWLFGFLNLTSGYLFFWAYSTTRKIRFDNIFTTRAPQQLVQQGPYRRIRHPYYTSYLLTYFSTLLLLLEAWNIAALMIILMLYIDAVQNEESLILGSENGSNYQEYRKNTKRFLPGVY